MNPPENENTATEGHQGRILTRESSGSRRGLIRNRSNRSMRFRKGDGVMQMELTRTPSRRSSLSLKKNFSSRSLTKGNSSRSLTRSDSNSSFTTQMASNRSSPSSTAIPSTIPRSNSYGSLSSSSSRSRRKTTPSTKASYLSTASTIRRIPFYAQDLSDNHTVSSTSTWTTTSVWKSGRKASSFMDILWNVLVVGCLLMGFLIQFISLYNLLFRPSVVQVISHSSASHEDLAFDPAAPEPEPELVFYPEEETTSQF